MLCYYLLLFRLIMCGFCWLVWLLLTVLNAPLLCLTALANRIFLVAGHGHDSLIYLGAFR